MKKLQQMMRPLPRCTGTCPVIKEKSAHKGAVVYSIPEEGKAKTEGFIHFGDCKNPSFTPQGEPRYDEYVQRRGVLPECWLLFGSQPTPSTPSRLEKL